MEIEDMREQLAEQSRTNSKYNRRDGSRRVGIDFDGSNAS